jgi:dihydrofolate reductase
LTPGRRCARIRQDNNQKEQEMQSVQVLSIIVAMASGNHAIGKGGALPWHLTSDLTRFKATTMGHPVIMGRKTWESIPPTFRPLPGRTNIVVTRDQAYTAPGAIVVHSLDEAITAAEGSPGAEEVFVAGGGELYGQALPRAQQIYLTTVRATVEDADTFFPELSGGEWVGYDHSGFRLRHKNDSHKTSFIRFVLGQEKGNI